MIGIDLHAMHALMTHMGCHQVGVMGVKIPCLTFVLPRGPLLQEGMHDVAQVRWHSMVGKPRSRV